MFKFEPLTVANVISIAQLLAVVLGFYFSYRSLATAINTLSLGTKNAQAQLFNQMVIQGRELQYRFMDLFHSSGSQADMLARQNQHLGAVIGYYAACFELKSALPLPVHLEKSIASDLRELMRQKQFRDKWEEVKHLHSSAFNSYVESNRGTP